MTGSAGLKPPSAKAGARAAAAEALFEGDFTEEAGWLAGRTRA